jgi:hypothetical protein
MIAPHLSATLMAAEEEAARILADGEHPDKAAAAAAAAADAVNVRGMKDKDSTCEYNTTARGLQEKEREKRGGSGRNASESLSVARTFLHDLSPTELRDMLSFRVGENEAKFRWANIDLDIVEFLNCYLSFPFLLVSFSSSLLLCKTVYEAKNTGRS